MRLPRPTQQEAERTARYLGAQSVDIGLEGMALLMCDVDMAEEAELRRLEGLGGASPRGPVVPAPSSSPPSCASFGVAEQRAKSG